MAQHVPMPTCELCLRDQHRARGDTTTAPAPCGHKLLPSWLVRRLRALSGGAAATARWRLRAVDQSTRRSKTRDSSATSGQNGVPPMAKGIGRTAWNADQVVPDQSEPPLSHAAANWQATPVGVRADVQVGHESKTARQNSIKVLKRMQALLGSTAEKSCETDPLLSSRR